MADNIDKTKAELLAELNTLRKKNAALREQCTSLERQLRQALTNEQDPPTLIQPDEQSPVQTHNFEQLEILSQIVQQMKDAVILTDADDESRIRYVNDAFTELYGYEKEEVLGKPSWILFAGDTKDKQHLQQQRKEHISQENEARVIYQDLHKDGTLFWVANTLSVVQVNDTYYDLGIVRDISVRKQTEEILQRRTAELEALRQLGMGLTAELELDTLLHTIVARAVELIGGRAGLIGLYDPEREILKWDTVIGDATVPYTTKPEEGVAGQIWMTREPLILDNYDDWDKQIPELEQRPITAVVGVPITWGDTFLGVLEVEGWSPGAYDQADAELLTLFGNQVAIALHNAQLFQAERKQREMSKALASAALAVNTALNLDQILDRILEQVARVVKGDACNIMFLESDNHLRVLRSRGYEALGLKEHITGFQIPVDKSVAFGEMMESNKPVVFADVTTLPGWVQVSEQKYLRSYVAAPIQIGDEVIGFLNVDSVRKEQFDEEDAQRLQAFANHVSVAIEHARLFQAEREQRKIAEALAEATFAVSGTLDFEQVLDRILEKIAQVLSGSAFNIMLVEDGVAHVTRWRGYERFGTETFVVNVEFPVAEVRNLQEMQATGKPVVIRDTRDYERWAVPSAQPWLRSYVGAPIQIEEETVGYLNVDSAHPNHFSEEDARHLQVFANYVATAINNARLFDETQRRVAELEALQRVVLRLTSSLELSDVLDTVAESVLSITHANDCHIFLYDEETGTFTFGAALWAGGSRIPFVSQPRADGLTATVVKKGEPLVINEVQKHPLYRTEKALSWGLESIAGFPLKWRDRVLGALTVAFLESHTFTKAEIRVLGLLADHVAIAIENAQLHRQVVDHATGLEERVAERTQQLQTQYARIQAILNNTSDGLVVTDKAGEILHANPVARHLFNKALPPEEASRLRHIIQSLGKQADQHPEQVLEIKGLDLQLKAAPILEGDPGGAAVVNIHDVTHLNAMHRMRAQFITNVSHELRTPATTIKLYADLLREAPPEKWDTYLDALITEAQQQAKLVENILHISRIDAGRLAIKPAPASLNELTKKVIARHRVLAQQDQLSLTYRPSPDNPTVLMDSDNFELVINNLLRNAIQYTPEGGRVTVTIDRVEHGERSWATLTVADTGIGIPEEELPYVFDRFFRGALPQDLQISGTGLGLAIVQQLVELHGGLITVESEADEGTTFTVWIPLAGADR